MTPFSADQLAALLDEADHAPWESVRAALSGVEGQPHPRIGWLTTHLAVTKREYWGLIAAATGAPPPPDDYGLTRLMAWEIGAARALSDDALTRRVVHAGAEFGVAELLRLNARHTAWHAGQIAALADRSRSA
ncbi:hypothetical protein [uncultured Deinococcus sp.]|uniref:hypothetical protein n=1 Tax=uncultured Deinococcus sp. TaxID=158789 RepID=UPI00259001A0|nr:hypothetical protein [uncultured Deinococcus sp.]